MKISRIVHNADIYTNEPYLSRKLPPQCRPGLAINAMQIWQDKEHYVVMFIDQDGLYLNRLDTIRLILLICRLSTSSACLVERSLKPRTFETFNLLDFQ